MTTTLNHCLAHFGEPFDQQAVPASRLEDYKDKLPGLLLDHWRDYGWCGYGDGLFWLVDPQAYACVVEAWLEGHPLSHLDTYHTFARSAFGDLYLWGEETGLYLTLDSCSSTFMVHNMDVPRDEWSSELQRFLHAVTPEENDFNGLFDSAKAQFGGLCSDEVYGFCPAIRLGGSGTLKHLEKTKAIEHLTLLSQLAGLTLDDGSED